jgi:hypothetical protein
MAHAVASGRTKDRELGDNKGGVTPQQLKNVVAELQEETAEPTKRTSKKAAPKDVADILDDWADV